MLFLFDFSLTFRNRISAVFKNCPIRSLFAISFMPVHYLCTYSLNLYSEEMFKLMLITCTFLALTFSIKNPRLILIKVVCFAYMGMLPVLLLIFIPEHEIWALCVHFLAIMFMTILEESPSLLLALSITGSISWIAFLVWLSSNVAQFEERKVTIFH